MDKYEYRLKTEHIKKLVAKKDIVTAMKICDTIDWNRVKDVKMLTTVSEVYETNGRYEEAIDALLQAYEYAPIGRRIVYRLTELALDCGNYKDAESYYQEFVQLAPNDLSGIILKYKLAKAKGVPTLELIKILEEYKEQDFDEKWAYELAELYHKAGDGDACVKLCNEIILWFSLGKYVEKAMKLKSLYVPLTESQKEKSVENETIEIDVDLLSSEKKKEHEVVKDNTDIEEDWEEPEEVPVQFDEMLEKSKATFAQILSAGNDSSINNIKKKVELDIRQVKEDFENVPSLITAESIAESEQQKSLENEIEKSEAKPEEPEVEVTEAKPEEPEVEVTEAKPEE
ncbi:MAG: tetratricopeptide repeat protein, partial [Lachnospiraceae bacterium]